MHEAGKDDDEEDSFLCLDDNDSMLESNDIIVG